MLVKTEKIIIFKYLCIFFLLVFDHEKRGIFLFEINLFKCNVEPVLIIKIKSFLQFIFQKLNS